MSYNEDSAKRFGWSPYWFGTTDFGYILDRKVKQFQERKNLVADSKVGPSTFAALYEHFSTLPTLMDSKVSSLEPQTWIRPRIIANNRSLFIDYDDVKVSFKHFNKFVDGTNYRKKESRDTKYLILHWDAALSADSCFNILQKRGVSTHFCIDNDGVIQQYLDVKDVAYHARGFNNNSIGVDISNAYYLKYADDYVKMGLPPRPVIESRVHGRDSGKHLGYYPEQIYSFKCLIKTLIKEKILNVLYTAYDEEGNYVEGVWPVEEHPGGIYSHYHLTENKIDTAGINLQEIVKECTSELYDEYYKGNPK